MGKIFCFQIYTIFKISKCPPQPFTCEVNHRFHPLLHSNQADTIQITVIGQTIAPRQTIAKYSYVSVFTSSRKNTARNIKIIIIGMP